jgi:hypothetical protein
MITAGKKSDVHCGNGTWVFLDIGFSNNGKTCGLAFDDESPRSLQYGKARKEIVDRIRKHEGLVNLVIEAPLSVCFDCHGNPKGRKIERRGSKTRYWYGGLGCAVLTAAMYLIRDIQEATKEMPNIEIRLFEGFVSFKESGTEHAKDVSDLRDKVKNSKKHQGCIHDSEALKFCESDVICSAFCVADLDCGVPAVIVVE